MASDALGSRANGFTNSEFAAFTYEFETFLIHRYLSQIVSFKGSGIDILDTQVHPINGMVTIHTLGGVHEYAVKENTNERAKTSYWLRNLDGEWTVIKVVIDGVDLSSSNNQELNDFLFQSSPKLIIANLKALNRMFEGHNPFE